MKCKNARICRGYKEAEVHHLTTRCAPVFCYKAEYLCLSEQYWYEGDEVGDLPVDFSIVWDGDFFIDKPLTMKGTYFKINNTNPKREQILYCT